MSPLLQPNVEIMTISAMIAVPVLPNNLSEAAIATRSEGANAISGIDSTAIYIRLVARSSMVTINTPRKRLNPTFRFGFFISPAMKVTLFQASLEKMEPTMAETIPAKMAAPNVGIADSVAMSQRIVRQASDQLVSHISELK